MRSKRISAAVGTFCLLTATAHAQVPGRRPLPPPPVQEPQVVFSGTPRPLLSLENLQFLEGTWSAVTRDGKQQLGSYSFIRELNGTVLARRGVVDPNCDPVKHAACARHDLFYIYQDSAGAPLSAISFDSEGHVLHYLVTQNAEASTSTYGRRDFVVFDSDPAQFGPRVRLRYERNIDTATGKESLSGAFELLLPDGTFHPLQQWFGMREAPPLTAR